jgi:hypothetical protein
MEDFRLALEYCSLSDMGYKGAKFTWNNKQSDGGFIKERLDRVLGNNRWREICSDVGVQVLPSRASDHKPLLIALMTDQDEHRYVSRGFKFEVSWLLDEDYSHVVQEAWHGDGGSFTAAGVVKEKLASCQTRLKNWSRIKFG